MIEYENGDLLKWMRCVVYPEQNNYELGWKENISCLQEPKKDKYGIVMKTFDISVPFEIIKKGLISIRIPDRALTGSIDQIGESMPELGFLPRGELLQLVKKEFGKTVDIVLAETFFKWRISILIYLLLH